MSCKAGFLLDLFLSDSRLRGRVNEWTPFFIFLSLSSSLYYELIHDVLTYRHYSHECHESNPAKPNVTNREMQIVYSTIPV